MIKIKKTDCPEYLSRPHIEERLVTIKQEIDAPEIEHDIPDYWRNNTVRDELYTAHYEGKCCYCERRRDRTREPDVEHFRPKKSVKNTSHPGYWWLAYDWNNLLWSCKACNEDYKRTKFPIFNEDKRASNYCLDENIERPKLINPRREDPAEYIGFSCGKYAGRYYVRPIAKPHLTGEKREKANATINIVGLDRDTLASERGEALQGLMEIADNMKIALKAVLNLRMSGKTEDADSVQVEVDRLATQIGEATNPRKTFCGVRREFFIQQELGQYLADF